MWCGFRVRVSGVSGQGLVLRFGTYAIQLEVYGLNGGDRVIGVWSIT